MEASVNGHAEVVDTLLQHGARVDLKKEVNLLGIIRNKCAFYYVSSCSLLFSRYYLVPAPCAC